MATYHVSQNGTASKDNAVFAGSPMSIATHNAATFAAGDIIKLVDDGTVTTQIIPPSSGGSGAPIVYECGSASISPSSGSAVRVEGATDYVQFDNVWGHGNGDAAYIAVVGAAGAGGSGSDDITVVFNAPRVLSNGGGSNSNCDGISVAGGVSDTARATFNSPFVRDCYNTSAVDAGDQAFTVHESGIGVFNNVDVDNCGAWVVNTASSRCVVNGGIMRGALVETVTLGGTCSATHRTIISNVRMINDNGATAPKGTSSSSADATMLVVGGSYKEGGTAAQTASRNRVLFANVDFDFTDEANTFSYFASVNGQITFSGCNFGHVYTALAGNGYFFRNDADVLNFYRCTMDSWNPTVGTPYFITHDPLEAGDIRGNVFKNHNGGAQPLIWLRGDSTSINIDDNIFANDTASSNPIFDIDGTLNNFNRNTFVNVSDVFESVGVITNATGNSGINSESLASYGGADLTDEELNVAMFLNAATKESRAFSILDNLTDDVAFAAIHS